MGDAGALFKVWRPRFGFAAGLNPGSRAMGPCLKSQCSGLLPPSVKIHFPSGLFLHTGSGPE
jgi:hypothetical protein